MQQPFYVYFISLEISMDGTGRAERTERKDGKEEMNWENLGWKEIKRERMRGGNGERGGKGSGQESENGREEEARPHRSAGHMQASQVVSSIC